MSKDPKKQAWNNDFADFMEDKKKADQIVKTVEVP